VRRKKKNVEKNERVEDLETGQFDGWRENRSGESLI